MRGGRGGEGWKEVAGRQGGSREGGSREGGGGSRETVSQRVSERSTPRPAHRELACEATSTASVKPRGGCEATTGTLGSQSQGSGDTRDTFKAQRRGVYAVTSM